MECPLSGPLIGENARWRGWGLLSFLPSRLVLSLNWSSAKCPTKSSLPVVTLSFAAYGLGRSPMIWRQSSSYNLGWLMLCPKDVSRVCWGMGEADRALRSVGGQASVLLDPLQHYIPCCGMTLCKSRKPHKSRKSQTSPEL